MPCQTTILDGAQGTRLQQFGLPATTPSPRWNIENPARVMEMHKLYAEAGSQILETNTFGAADESEFEAALRCIEPFAKQCRIAGAIGPHTVVRHSGILSSLIDFYVIETFSDLRTTGQVFSTLEKYGKPIVVSLAWVYDGAFRLFSNEYFDQVIAEVSNWPLMAFGANCSLGTVRIVELATQLSQSIDLELWIKCNAGQPRWLEGKALYDQTPQEFARDLNPLIGKVHYLGGCCGTDEGHIAALRGRIASSV